MPDPDEPGGECCGYRDHNGAACAYPDPRHEGDPLHPFANFTERLQRAHDAQMGARTR